MAETHNLSAATWTQEYNTYNFSAVIRH